MISFLLCVFSTVEWLSSMINWSSLFWEISASLYKGSTTVQYHQWCIRECFSISSIKFVVFWFLYCGHPNWSRWNITWFLPYFPTGCWSWAFYMCVLPFWFHPLKISVHILCLFLNCNISFIVVEFAELLIYFGFFYLLSVFIYLIFLVSSSKKLFHMSMPYITSSIFFL